MAFNPPSFPLMCNLYRGPYTGRVLAGTLPCNLAQGSRVYIISNASIPQVEEYNLFPQLLMPALSDVRDLSNAITPDVVEVPAGSGRWYGVCTVDDVGKGFPNEYRIAIIGKIFEALDPAAYPGLFWPVPMP